MSAENSRTYSTDDDGESNYGAMESVHNSGAEDGASDGAGMDSEKIRHGKLSLSKSAETEDDASDDSNDSSSHTPAQKPKRRRHLSMSPPKSPSPNRRRSPTSRSSSRFNTIRFPIPLHGAGLDSGVRESSGPMLQVGVPIKTQRRIFIKKFPE